MKRLFNKPLQKKLMKKNRKLKNHLLRKPRKRPQLRLSLLLPKR